MYVTRVHDPSAEPNGAVDRASSSDDVGEASHVPGHAGSGLAFDRIRRMLHALAEAELVRIGMAGAWDGAMTPCEP